MSNDPGEQPESPENPADPTVEAPEPGESTDRDSESPPGSSERRSRVLIGSQRDPTARRRKRDWTPIEGEGDHEPTDQEEPAESAATQQQTATADEPPVPEASTPAEEVSPAEQFAEEFQPEKPIPGKRFPPPNIRGQLSPELEDEFDAALGEESVDELLAGAGGVSEHPFLEPESKHTGQVLAFHREDAFVELGGREQGVVPLKLFAEPPEVGASVEVIVARFNREEGLYELTIPHAAVDVEDWSQLAEGMMVEARITGHNTGGLECEVHRLRGFIPVSQISLYRVENLEEFVDEKFNCLVTEVNPQRRNLVLSRRAVLEKEREEAKQQLLGSLAPGQVHEGIVRKLVDFGAFVDLGGVDGLLHISQLAWGRVEHPSDVIKEGQKIKVRIDKIDLESERISLAYRDMLESPWESAAEKFPPNSIVSGKVVKLMEFGAFVELEPGVEGLVHISELSHKRVWRPSEVVHEGEQIDVMVLSVDPEAQRISLSIRQVLPEPEPIKQEEKEAEKPPEPEDPAAVAKPPKKPSKPLKGGLGRSPGGSGFGLKW